MYEYTYVRFGRNGHILNKKRRDFMALLGVKRVVRTDY